MLVDTLKVNYYIKNIDENKYVDVYWEDKYVLVERNEVSQCIYLSKQEAIEELKEMSEQDERWVYIVEEVFEIS